MKPSTDLFELVHSLSPSEKRYFRLFCSRSGEDRSTNSLRIFDAVLTQNSYDESALKLEFKGEKLLDNFPSEKHYLYQLVLRAMRNYHHGKTPEAQLHHMRQDLSFLAGKGHHAAAKKLLRKAKKLAETHQLFGEWLGLLGFERQYIKVIYRKNLAGKLEEIVKEKEKVRGKWEQEMDLLALYDQYLALVRRHNWGQERLRAAAQELREHFLLQSFPSNGSFNAKSCYWLCSAIHARLHQDNHTALQSWRNNIELWQAHPEKLKSETHSYRRAVSNYLAACSDSGDRNDYEWGLEAMNALPRRTFQEKLEHFTNYSFNRFYWWLEQGKMETAQANLPEIEADLNRFEKGLTPSRLIAFCYNIAVLQFFTNSPTPSNQYLQRILNGDFGEVRTDLQLRARWLLLPVHFDLGHLDLWEHLSGSLKRATKRLRPLSEAENRLARLLSKAYRAGKVDITDPDDLAWIQDGEDFPVEEIRYWLQAKLTGESLADTYRTSLTP